MKTGPDALSTVENESGSTKHVNRTRHPRERKKMKAGPDALGTVENESGSGIHENGTRRPRYYRK
jgi:hypothetical protein